MMSRGHVLLLLYLVVLATIAAGFSISNRASVRVHHATRRLLSQWDDDAFTPSKVDTRSKETKSPSLSSPSSTTTSNARLVDRIEKFSRLPVWPVWNGVFIFLLSKLFGDELAAKVEDAVGGRVCPNFFVPEQTSPFIMLVHHRHSFAPWDLLRYIQRTFFPEGFPAHPHRGFVTVTYFLKGGFRHRDSMGIKQMYGAEERHQGKHTQWLTTGAGVLHEEMFDIAPDNNGIAFLQPSSQELYQLWLNVPASHKMDSPRVDLLGGDDETPTVKVVETDGSESETIVLAGSYQGNTSTAPCLSEVALFHVKMQPRSTWRHELARNYRTVIIYVRRGAIMIGDTRVPPQYTAYLSPTGSELTVTTANEAADFLFLAGEPLNEPVSAQGSMVMNYPDEINVAYSDYQYRKMGAPWDHKISDEEWMEHVKRYPSTYKQIG